MGDAKAMLEASPSRAPLELTAVAAAIEACLNTLQTCTSCADADVAEDDVAELRTCVGLCLTCADVCGVTARVLSRPAAWDRIVTGRLLEACVRACTSCAEECSRHAEHHVHCAVCERSCRACEEACRELLDDEALRELSNLAGG